MTVPPASPWAGALCRPVSQVPPPMVNGIQYRDGVLWIASFLGGDLIAADAGTGEIIGRFGPPEGVNTGPDDLAIAEDGTVYWTGFGSGDVGVLSPGTGRSHKLANVGAGANPVVLAPDGSLIVGHAYLGTGLMRIDVRTGRTEVIDAGLALNAFAVGPDGALYAPRTDTVPARAVRVDLASGPSTTVAPNIGLFATSLKFPPPSRGEAPETAYVLSGTPNVVRRVDVRTGQRAGADIRVPMPMADNLAFAPDGTLYVTSNLGATVLVAAVDGTSRTLTIGRR